MQPDTEIDFLSMVISYKWLLEYLPEQLPLNELSEILTSIGLEVEGVELVEYVKGSLEGLVIGEVKTCEPHTNADKLKVTTVDIGQEELLHIVCGAPNVAAGQKVVVAPVGTTIYPIEGEPFGIKKAKIRGEVSHGMICAEDEIGLGESHDGIMILPEDAKVGTLAKDYFSIPEPDYAIHIGLTPNRSDAMSHLGVAKDVAAYMTYHKGETYSAVLPKLEEIAASNTNNTVSVQVVNEDACPRYMGLSIDNIQVKESPDWLKQKLKSISLRPINNVVDITNFVLHEFGQPLHAFDIDKISGKAISVKCLDANTNFVTLDGAEVKLSEEDLMICDNEGGMCIAGVYGGKGSGVTENTKSVFIESAYFNPLYVRRTSLRHGLRTDAATHFEKGVDIKNVPLALKRAAQLIVEIASGEIASDVIDVYPNEVRPVTVEVKYDYINKLSGKKYDNTAVKALLQSLGFTVKSESEEGLVLSVPTNKPDVLQPADVVEEVLRMDGLDNIPIPEKLNISLTKPMINDRSERNKIANILCGIGFREIVTNSIVNSKYYPDEKGMVKMLNSLTSELDVMRPSMVESGLEVIQYNCNRKNTDLLLFEYGKVYHNYESGYDEQNQLVLFATGNVQQLNWNQKEVRSDVFYLKGVVDSLISYSGINRVKVNHTDTETQLVWKKKVLCTVKGVSDKRLYDFDVKQSVSVAVINWDIWLEAMADTAVKYKEVPKYPSVQRDLAIILDKNITYGQVQQATDQLNINALQDYNLFDVFESDKLGKDKKSYALSYTFQLTDRTLTDKETEAIMSKLVSAYKKDLQAEIRE